jgi:Spy/CpxP family protein refolding chaperone
VKGRRSTVFATPANGSFVAADVVPGPYAGQQTRTIKALSEDDVRALRKGEGMGMAKPAELNGYPGPAHVLSLAKQLSLTDDQSRKVRLVFDQMSAEAKPLGEEVISHERALDQLFADGHADNCRVTEEVVTIGHLPGRLRMAHLAAHLATRDILTAEQIASYRQLRGYDDTAVPHHGHHPG